MFYWPAVQVLADLEEVPRLAVDAHLLGGDGDEAQAIPPPQTLTEPTDVFGTVESEILESWNLSYRLIGEAGFVELVSGAFPVTAGGLGTFDPTLLLNGLYELRLEATDLQGQIVEQTIAVAVEGQMKVGHFTLSFVDLAIPLSGLDIEIIRTYDSRDKRQGDFGVGWTLDIRQGSYRNNRRTGDGWQIVASDPPVPFPCAGSVETQSHLTVIRLSDQEVYRFRPRVVDTIPGVGRCDGRVVFEYVDGPIPGATLDILGNDLVFYLNNSVNDQLIDFDTLEVFEPADVRFTTRDGRIFDLNLATGVTHLEDPHGNALEISPQGITHSNGRGVELVRDAEGRIERIVDPRGNDLLYGYDAAGDLRTVTNQAEHVTRFEYDDAHRIVDILDPQGVRAVRSDYDADGRLVSVTDALGNPIELHHDLEANQEIVTNRLGLV
ncbi:MAG: RHS repeat protein, partial [bacterium]|nr:RHS repeat protein [bacterium]